MTTAHKPLTCTNTPSDHAVLSEEGVPNSREDHPRKGRE
jgi:hypothetical protein